jgi:hypothetical protein
MYRKKLQTITDDNEDRFQIYLQGVVEDLENDAEVDNSSISIQYQFKLSPTISDEYEYKRFYSALITWKQWDGERQEPFKEKNYE